MQAPIYVADNPLGDPTVPYDPAWMETVNGRHIVSMQLPGLVRAEPERFLFEQPQGHRVFDVNDIPTCEKIPLSTNLFAAQLIINRLKSSERNVHEGWILFKDFGLVTPHGVNAMQRIHRVIEFSRNIQSLNAWLGTTGGAWTELRHELLEATGIMYRVFSSYKDVWVYISDLFTLKGEGWLTGALLDSVTDMFMVQYGHTNGFMILPSNAIPGSRRLAEVATVLKEHADQVAKLERRAQEQLEAKMFAIVNTGNHWGVLCVDFTNQTILFGHSTDHGTTLRLDGNVLMNVQQWLRGCQVNPETWKKGTTRCPTATSRTKWVMWNHCCQHHRTIP
jgi:hypothetical protein